MFVMPSWFKIYMNHKDNFNMARAITQTVFIVVFEYFGFEKRDIIFGPPCSRHADEYTII